MSTKPSEDSGAGVIVDKKLVKLLNLNKDKELTVLPGTPPDSEDFEEDVKQAMEKLSKSGKSFWEETKMKFRELRRRT